MKCMKDSSSLRKVKRKGWQKAAGRQRWLRKLKETPGTPNEKTIIEENIIGYKLWM